jgi:hypothetical protein
VDGVIECPTELSRQNDLSPTSPDEDHLGPTAEGDKDPEEFEMFLEHYIYGATASRST